MSTEAFGETLQFITNVKLDELEKRRQKFFAHATTVVAESKAHGDSNPIERLGILVDGMKTWSGAWSSDMNLADITRYLEQARRDPGFPHAVLDEWILRAEEQIEHEGTRYDYARLFGNLLTDWLKSKSPSPASSPSPAFDRDVSPDGFEKVNRKETLEQKAQLESIIFTEKDIDVDALKAYLTGLFSSTEAEEALEKLRKRIKKFARDLHKRTIQTKELEKVIRSVLQTDVLSDEKQATLKEFLRKPPVIKELTGVLNMQLSSIKSWSWPQGGVPIEPRRHLNGKTRFYLDTEILTCLLLHYLGMIWAIEFKENLDLLRDSRVWKLPPRRLTRVDHKRRDAFVSVEERSKTIDSLRREYQRNNFFMCQLPTSLDTTVDNYKDDAEEDNEVSWAVDKASKFEDLAPRFDTPVNVKQSLLHILSADLVLNKTFHGKATVVRTDLEWFGPSLPFATITTVLEFFGMPDEDVQFFKTFLSCPVVFKDDPSGFVRTRSRGVPISYMLSTLCGELVMFVMDFAVNQRANGLYLHRIHDDFWFWDADASRCALAWAEMQRYAGLAGLRFNEEKTGSIVIGSDVHPDPVSLGLPGGEIRWGFLQMNANGQFVVDQAMIDQHVLELRRQLEATTSIFGWTQAYNKYMAFVVRNCGAPALVYGKAHIDGIIDTLARIQTALFSDASGDDSVVGRGSFVTAVSQMLNEKLDVSVENIPYGWYLWPNAAGGLEVKDPLVELFLVRDGYKEKSVDEILKRARAKDERKYAEAKQRWESGEPGLRVRKFGSLDAEDKNIVSADEPFFTFEEFTKGREERGEWWYKAYAEMLQRPARTTVTRTPQLEASLKVLGEGIEAFKGAQKGGWSTLSPYWQWVIGLHHDTMVKKFGSLAVVEPSSVPVGMVSVFKSSRMRWEQ